MRGGRSSGVAAIASPPARPIAAATTAASRAGALGGRRRGRLGGVRALAAAASVLVGRRRRRARARARASAGQRPEEPARGLGGVLRRQQHDQRRARGERAHLGERGIPVGVDELRLDRRHRVHERGQQRRAVDARDAGADHAVEHQQVHVVARPGGEGGEQQRGLHRGIHPHAVADARGRRAARVDDDHDVAVALGAPGAQHRRARPRRRAPVDRAHVVAAHVLAQAVELGALPAHLHARVAVELAQPREPRGQVPAGGERRQHAHGAGRVEARLASGEAQRAVRAHDDEPRCAARRVGGAGAGSSTSGVSPGGMSIAGRSRRRAGGRLPGVAHASAQRPRSRCCAARARRARACPSSTRRGTPPLAPCIRRGSGAAAASASASDQAQQQPRRRREPRVDARRREQHDGHRAEGDEQRRGGR